MGNRRETEPLGRTEMDEIRPGDIVRSLYGRSVRAVLCVTEIDAVLRTPTGKAESVPLNALRRFWRKVGTIETYDMSGWSEDALKGCTIR